MMEDSFAVGRLWLAGVGLKVLWSMDFGLVDLGLLGVI